VTKPTPYDTKIHHAKFGVEGYSGSSKQAIFYLDINWEIER